MFIDASANDNGIYIEASESTETIKGGAGNDTLVGGLGIDSLVGGKGDDKFLVLGAATSGQVAGDIIVGGEGTNEILLDNDDAAFAATFDFDNISEVLTIKTLDDADNNSMTSL